MTYTKILSDRDLKFRLQVWCTCSEPVWSHSSQCYDTWKSLAEVKAHYISWAKGDYADVIARVWDVLNTPDKLKPCGLTVEVESVSEAQLFQRSSERMQAEDRHADMMCRTCAAIARTRNTTHAHYMHSLPGAFALFFGSDADRNAGLAFCKRLFDAMIVCEKKRFDFQVVSRLFSAVAWAHNVPIREALTMLAELEFKIPHPEMIQLAETFLFLVGARRSSTSSASKVRVIDCQMAATNA